MPHKPPVDDDPDAPPTEEERARAEALRSALEDKPGSNDEADLARALRAAWSPSELSAARHQGILEEALARSVGAGRPLRSPRRARVLRVVFGAGTIVALAAGVAGVVRTESSPQGSSYEIATAVATSRSTQPLFAEAFARHGGESSRIDRIALARQSDLRDNEFARWGAR
jgi:hypothetical protein